MAAKTTAFAGALLDLILNNAALPNIGDAAGLQPSGADGVLYLSLHTADPGVGGNQTTNECAYTGYSRISVARTGALWTVVAPSATNAGLLTWGACTAGSTTATYVGVGTDASPGAGNLLYRALITNPAAGLVINPGITPQVAIGAATITES